MSNRVFVAGLLTVFPAFGMGIAQSETEVLQPVRLQQIKVDGFRQEQYKRLTEKWIPHCIRQMEKGGRGEELMNLFYAGQVLDGKEPEGKYTGRPWSDAYPYNTIESICLALAIDPEGDEQPAKAQDFLREKMNEWIPIILAAQCEDGYIHFYHIVNGRDRYSDPQKHEFYVMGYFIEMGVAHYRMSRGNDRRLYEAAVRCGEHLCETFGPKPKRMWFHGHPGMGYALCRLARLVNEVAGGGKVKLTVNSADKVDTSIMLRIPARANKPALKLKINGKEHRRACRQARMQN